MKKLPVWAITIFLVMSITPVFLGIILVGRFLACHHLVVDFLALAGVTILAYYLAKDLKNGSFKNF